MEGCTYPIENKFARAATPKLCRSKDGAIAVAVPYYDHQGKMFQRMQMLCTLHCCEIALWKYIRNIPRQPLMEDEIDLLLSTGYSQAELQAEGLMLPDETPEILGELPNG